MTDRSKITLIHPPTVALRISGFSDPDFDLFADSGVYLGNIYRRIIPPSLPRVASILEREGLGDVDIFDLRIADHGREDTYKTVDWEGYTIEARRVGGAFAMADDAIRGSEWIGLSSHFTYESGIVRDLMAHAKRVNPKVKLMVGGADVIARPRDYMRFGADLAFVGDFNPKAFAAWDGTPTIVAPHKHRFDELAAPSFEKLPRLDDYDDSHDGPVPAGVPFPIGFIYFTRGCPRECDFCESRRTGFEVLDLESSLAMLRHYHKAGVRTLNFADDNLLILAARPDTREHLLELIRTMRELEFAWEFPNGLEIGRLVRDGVLDEEVMQALFARSVSPTTGKVVGAYRAYIPIETFDQRTHYSKLKPVEEQNRVIEWLAAAGLPELDFGVVIPPDADETSFEHTRDGYLQIRDIIHRNGPTLARYAAFHLIPIALYRDTMPTKYSVDEFPEGWNFYFPVYDGKHYSARQLFERRLRLLREIDQENFASMRQGQYGYG